MPLTESSDRVSNRRDERQSVPPGLEAPAPPPSPSDEAGAERVMDTADSLRLDHAKQLRRVLEQFATDYDLEEHKGRFGQPVTWGEGATAACAICADPGPVIAAFLSTLDTAIEHACDGEVVDHE